MDDVIFEEFKGTGNMEVHLDRKLQEQRIFPAIDLYKSGTRKEELMLNKKQLDAVWSIRKAMYNQSAADVAETLITWLNSTKNNDEFIEKVNLFFNK